MTPNAAGATKSAADHLRWLLHSNAFYLLAWVFVYTYAFPYFPINNPNENVRLYMSAALAEHHTYAIDALIARWGWVNDAASHHGHTFSVKAPGLSLIGAPFCWFYFRVCDLFNTNGDIISLTRWLRLTCVSLPCIASLFYFKRWLTQRQYPRSIVELTTLAVGAGSLLYAYGMLLFTLIIDAEANKRQLALAGLMTSLIVAFEYQAAIAMLALTLAAVFVHRKQWRHVIIFLLAMSPVALWMAHFHWSAFGNPFTPGHLYLQNEGFRELHQQGVYGVTRFHSQAIGVLLLSPQDGLLPYTPFLALSVLGIGHLYKNDRQSFLISATVVLTTFISICLLDNWRGGIAAWNIGPRFLALLVPLMAWWACEGASCFMQRNAKLAEPTALALSIAALIASGIPSIYYPHIPPEFTRPLKQLFIPLIVNNYAPFTLTNHLGIFGTLSMLPLFVMFAWLTLRAVHISGRAPKATLTQCAFALPFTLIAIAPLFIPSATTPAIEQAVLFVTSHWTPAR